MACQRCQQVHLQTANKSPRSLPSASLSLPPQVARCQSRMGSVRSSMPCRASPRFALAAGHAAPREEVLGEALRIQQLLGANTEELKSVVRALNGEYVLPEAGGDLLRDGAGGWGGTSQAWTLGPCRAGPAGPPLVRVVFS